MIEPAVELLLVPIRNRDVVGAEAVPDLLEKPETLVGRQSEDGVT
jgi:hypothetical protein